MIEVEQNKLNPNRWVELYADYLFNFAFARVSEVEIAKDLVQETFLAGVQSAVRFKGDATERTWLVAILKRKIADYFRKINSKKGRLEVKFFDSKDGHWLSNATPQPWEAAYENIIENEELKKVLERCMAKLPQKNALVFQLKTLEDVETEEICNDLDITPSNLWVLVHRARTQLRACLETNWFKK